MEIVPKLFYPLLATAIVIVVDAVAIILVNKFKPNYRKLAIIIGGILLLASLIVTFVFMSLYYEDEIATSGWYPSMNTIGMIVSLVCLVIVLVVFFALGNKPKSNDTRAIVFGAISIAMSFALSYVRLFKLPQGGSVTLASLLPLMVYCCMFGTRRGIITCFIYGTLQAMQDPFIIHPAQFLLDYSVAFSFIGISGLFVEKDVFKGRFLPEFIVGSILAVAFRYTCHIFSGAFAFADYIGEGYTVWAWTFVYNSFALVDMAICIVCGCLLFASKSFTAQMMALSSSSISFKRKKQTLQDDDIDEENNSEDNSTNDENVNDEKSDDSVENN